MRFNTMKLSAIFVVVLMIASIAMLAMPVNAQSQSDQSYPHGGVAPVGGYNGPSTQPSNAPANTIPIDSNPYIAVSPNPTGVNQYILINFWITPPPTNQRYFNGFTVTITKPDGTNDTLGPLNSYMADGTNWAQYTVTQVGNYSFQFSFAGEYFAAGYYNAGVLSSTTSTGAVLYPAMYYKPATSPVTHLTVVDHQVLSYPSRALPTDYWTRPISPDNREWYAIGGPYPWPWTNWNQDDYGPYLYVPLTNHIVWYDVQQLDGIIGGDTGPVSQTTAPATSYVTYAGRGYESKYVSINGVPTMCAVSYDLRTGQQYYAIPGAPSPYIVSEVPAYTDTIGAYHPASYELLGGQIRDQRERQIGTTLIKINPVTGATTNYTGVLAGVFYNGEYVLSVQTIGTGSSTTYRLINWTTAGTGTFASRIISNISFPISDIGAWNDFNIGVTVLTASFTDGLVFGGNLTAVSLITGQVLWTKDLGTETMFNSNRVGTVANGKLAICMENRYFDCWDMLTGNLVWKSQLTEYPWGDFWSYDSTYYNGLLMAGNYEGFYAFNMTNGNIVWNFKSPSVPYETPYDEYSWHSSSFAANGVLVSFTDEHTPSEPLTRGWNFYAINTTDGTQIWKLAGFNSDARFCAISLGDGYMTLPDQYTGTDWTVGRGLTATTVNAPSTAVPLGTAVMIKGTVLDMSPAQPNTPCVSQASMETQMEYLHMGQPIAGLWGNETITGVPVTLQAIDANNKVIEIGTTTTNGYYGTFSMAWTPPAAGTYQIVAAFASNDAYASSGAATGLLVGPAPTVAPTASPPAAPVDYMPTLTGILVAVIVAIVVSVIALVVVLRKHA